MLREQWEKTSLWELISGILGGGGLVRGPDKGSAWPGSSDSLGRWFSVAGAALSLLSGFAPVMGGGGGLE